MDFACDDGDMRVVDGDFVLIDGFEEIRQEVATSLQLYEGEARLDQAAGIPRIIFEPGLSDAERGQLVAQVILDVPGIVRVAQPTITIEKATRAMTIAYEATASLNNLSERISGTVTLGG